MHSELTPQQRRAVDHRGSSVVLASGAGCGKTHVLTARYLSHLTADAAEVGQVVAITFTDRAAHEMRDRIRSAVDQLPDAARHLRALETAPVATIHSFCGNLLRQYAVPAGLDPGFEVLDDVLAATLRTESLQACLHALLEIEAPYPPAAAALRELVVLFGWNAVVEAADGLLLSADRPAWAKWLARSPDDIAAEWAGPARAELLPEWVAYLAAASPKITGCLSLLARVRSANPQVNANVQQLLTETPQLHTKQDIAAAAHDLSELAKVGRSGKKDWPDERVYEAVKEAFTDFRADLPKRLALFAEPADDVAAAARVGQLFLRVAVAADDAYRQRKHRAGVLDFQDLLTLARDLLRDRDDVRDSLRSRFRFLLLDELQDTDPVQMELVELLCGAGLEHGMLFAVGDHKQSIYRFRGAEVGLFQNLRNSVAVEGRLGLTRNYRSQPGVLKFVNALFGKRVPDYEPLEAHHPGTGEAANVEFLWAECGTRNAECGIEDQPDAVPPSSIRNPQSAIRIGEIRHREAEAIAARIAELLDDPTPRVREPGGPPRRVERKDIVLLFRSMSHVATYEAALRRHGLDYYLIGGRAFFAQQEVYDLLNLLRAVENPQDGASLVGTLRSPFCGLSDEAVFLLAAHPDGPWAGLRDGARIATLPADQQPAAARAKRFLEQWRAVKDQLPLARLLNAVFADSGYDAAMQFEYLGDRKLANLWKLVDLARTFDRTGLFGLHEFIARLGDLVARQPREEQAATLPENADVVKLMSIHQAKGLEFPVVIVPDLAAGRRGDLDPVARWHRRLGCLVKLPAEFENLPEDGSGEKPPFPEFADRLGRVADQLADWQEDLRVLYVACTRARDLLILSAGLPEPLGEPLGGLTPPPRQAANHWTLALAERFDLRSGRCVAEDVRPEDRPAVRVNIVGPAVGEVLVTPRSVSETGGATLTPRGAASSKPSPSVPAVVPLPVLEQLARGEVVPTFAERFDTEDDADRSEWRHPRERLGPVSPAEAVLWAVLDRWDFADVDGWGQLLTDAAEDDPAGGRSLADSLRAKLRRLAESEVRPALAQAFELHRGVEFLADLRAFAADSVSPPPESGGQSPPVTPNIAVRGLIDFLYSDPKGWHVLGVDLGTADEDDPWRGRRPGLVLQAWAARQQLGEWPRSVQLFDLATGQLVAADPQRVKPTATAHHFATALRRIRGA
ncbi:MAG: Exodeoxyribonuclease [Gemmataceae bacterium]|nr:Exodeoxyribonuclease [Gemmataceae bacterium]